MSQTYSCAACCAETENEPQALCDACDQADRDAVAARLNRYREVLERIVANQTYKGGIAGPNCRFCDDYGGTHFEGCEIAAAIEALKH